VHEAALEVARSHCAAEQAGSDSHALLATLLVGEVGAAGGGGGELTEEAVDCCLRVLRITPGDVHSFQGKEAAHGPGCMDDACFPQGCCVCGFGDVHSLT
jgi:hypothetical protein